jgi:predicted secreted protein
MICDSPPPNECVDVGFLKIYDTNGSCADGVCTYTYQLIPCNDPPDACHQAAGHCTGASCQYDPVTACIDSDGCCPPGCAGQDDDCPAQSSWDRAYGGSDHYMAYSIQQTSDGGYILAGDTYSFDEAGYSNIDLWVLKLDASGNAAWQKTYGGDEGGWEQDWARSIQQTSDGGYIVAGYTTSFDAVYYDAWVLKLDASGNAAWQKTYGGERFDWVYSIQQTSDEGYIMAGKTDSFGAGWGYPYDAWVLKLDASGNAAWQKTYGGSGYDWAYSIQQTSDEGYIVAGKTDSFGVDGCDTWVLKLDASGNAAWQKTYGGSNSDMAYFIQQTSDDGYILAGETKSFGAGDYDAWVLKLDASGNTAWQKTYGGSMYDMASSIQQTSDGGYILAGNTDSFGAGGRDTWILKLDASGNVAWQKTYGGSDSDWASSVQQTSDWGYVVAGGTKSFGAGDYNAWVLKLEVDGVISGSCPDGIGADTNAVVASTSVSPENSTATTETPNTMVGDTDVVP